MLIKNTHIVDNQLITHPPIRSVIDIVRIFPISFDFFLVVTSLFTTYNYSFLLQNFLRYTASL